MLNIEKSQAADMLRQFSILFVDDDADVRDSMANYLGRRVSHIYTAENGEAGLSSFMAMRPDIVISDVRMQGMDGLTMCRRIRESEPDVPMIFISAHDESDVLLSSIDIGINKFIVKPVRTDVLMDAIIGVASLLDHQRKLANKLQTMSSNVHEYEYQSERVRDYVSHYLEANHNDGIPGVRHLSIPKLEVSGDFFSVVKNADDLYVMLADGAGHGLSAVIPALQIPGMFKQQAERGFSLRSIAASMNRALREQNFTEHFVAATLMRINQRERVIEILNCSNPAAYIIDDSDGVLYSAGSKGMALGMVDDAEFSAEVERFSMPSGGRIYLTTDGLVDTVQAQHSDFDYEKLRVIFESAESVSAFDKVASMAEESAAQYKIDDVTLLEIRFDADVIDASGPPDKASLPILLQPPEILPILDQISLLYVEDDDVTRDFLTRYLSYQLGMIYVAKDGVEGLSLFKKYRPKIVLADINMPGMDGLMMAEEIRKLDKEVPIILTSGAYSSEDTERMFEMGISRFHVKPLSVNKLSGTIHSCIQKHYAAQQKSH